MVYHQVKFRDKLIFSDTKEAFASCNAIFMRPNQVASPVTRLGRKYVAVQATSAASERIFSVA